MRDLTLTESKNVAGGMEMGVSLMIGFVSGSLIAIYAENTSTIVLGGLGAILTCTLLSPLIALFSQEDMPRYGDGPYTWVQRALFKGGFFGGLGYGVGLSLQIMQ